MKTKMKTKMTYAKAGVDILAEEDAIRKLTSLMKYRRRGKGKPIITSHYAGIVDLPGRYAVALTTDGVGTKILVANFMKKWDTIGIDCIAMNVNDLIAMNAEPLAFVDYLAWDKPDKKIASEIALGLSRGAEIANITIVGGETATLPGMLSLDLSGACIGIVKKDEIITGEEVEKGDILLGLPSSGIHSNGLSLARKVIESAGYSYTDEFPLSLSKEKIGEELLKPTRMYMEILKLTKKCDVHGLAHITGGGLLKLKRLTKLGFDFSNPLEPHPIFRWIQKLGKIDEREMYRTFNMGMGFLVVIPPEEERRALRILRDAKVVGEIAGKGIKVRSLRIDAKG